MTPSETKPTVKYRVKLLLDAFISRFPSLFGSPHSDLRTTFRFMIAIRVLILLFVSFVIPSPMRIIELNAAKDDAIPPKRHGLMSNFVP